MKIEQSLRKAYADIFETYGLLRPLVLYLIEEVCKQNNWLLIERIKSEESYALKILTGRSDGYEVDDFFACTIVVPNLLSIEAAKKLVSDCFEVRDEKPGEYINTRPTEFSFDGLRMYCTLVKSVTPNTLEKNLFEIQIKTLLEHAWSTATHDFSYKGQSISWAKERLSAQIKAILNNADLSIYEMERLANSGFLDKKYKKYIHISEIIDFMDVTFSDEHNIALPTDKKRLAQEIERLLRLADVSLNILRGYLDAETKVGRGYNTTNLSIYSIILVSLFNQAEADTLKNIKRNSRRTMPYLVIPRETEIRGIKGVSNLKRVQLLQEYNANE